MEWGVVFSDPNVMNLGKLLTINCAYKTGWWLTYPSEKYENQIGSSSQLLGKINSCSKPPTNIIFPNSQNIPTVGILFMSSVFPQWEASPPNMWLHPPLHPPWVLVGCFKLGGWDYIPMIFLHIIHVKNYHSCVQYTWWIFRIEPVGWPSGDGSIWTTRPGKRLQFAIENGHL